MTGRARLGRSGERRARDYLEARGHRILATNWRAGRREIDLVTLEAETVAFVEVKTRRPGPQPVGESLGHAQKRRLRRAAEAWIHAHPGVGREFRFDLVTVRWEGDDPPRIEHLTDAFFGDRLV